MPMAYRLQASKDLKASILETMQPERMAFGVLASAPFAPALLDWPTPWQPLPDIEALTAALQAHQIQGALVERGFWEEPGTRARVEALQDRYAVAFLTFDSEANGSDIIVSRNRKGRLYLHGKSQVALEAFCFRAGLDRFLMQMEGRSEQWALGARHAWDEATQTIQTELTLLRRERVAQVKTSHDGLDFTAPPAARMEDLVGLDAQKSALLQAVEELKAWRPGDPRPTGGILLEGPPGTGKTQLIAAVAKASGLPCVLLSASQLQSMYWGETERRIRDLFEQAWRHAPSIIGLDEFEGLGMSRQIASQSEPGFVASIVTTLLTAMNASPGKPPVLVLGATNYAERVDPAFLRPGRFDQVLHVGFPSAEARRAFLKSHLPAEVLEDSLLDHLVRFTQHKSMAVVHRLIHESQQGVATTDPAMRLREALVTSLIGPPGESTLTVEEKHTVAVHEAGHALTSAALLGQVPFFLTIRPRADIALGLCLMEPTRPETGLDTARVKAELAVLLAGRAAERLLLPAREPSSGAASDLQKATSLAHRAISEWGMDPDWGLMSIEALPLEVRGVLSERLGHHLTAWLREAEVKVGDFLAANVAALMGLADALQRRQDLYREEIEELVGGRGWAIGGSIQV
ncbi:MAG: AAA family ATPase [Acidobacteria bacterium]|nr:AAA family ATPase [Acidobacteriota bacterium]